MRQTEKKADILDFDVTWGFDQLMCEVDHPQFYGSVLIHVGGAATPKFEITKKIQIPSCCSDSKILHNICKPLRMLEKFQAKISNLGVATPPTWIRTDP